MKCEEISDDRDGKKLSKTIEVGRFFDDSVVGFDRIDGESCTLKELDNRVAGKKAKVCFVMNSAFSVRPMPFEYKMIKGIDMSNIWDRGDDASVWFKIIRRSAQDGPRID